jgi:hypothetical protein
VDEDGPVADDQPTEEQPDGVTEGGLADEAGFDGSHADAREGGRDADRDETLHARLLARSPTNPCRLSSAGWKSDATFIARTAQL